MSARGRIPRILAKRAILLSVALVVIMLLTAVILGATGYDEKILKAIVVTELQAYSQALRQQLKGSGEDIEKLIKEREQFLISYYGLDKPWWERVIPMAFNAMILNLGYSLSEEVANIAGLQPPVRVSDAILITLPRTIIMLTIAQLISIAIALPLAPFIAYRRGSIWDKLSISYAAFTNALPIWWLAIVAIYFVGFQLKIAPTSYRGVISYINRFWEDPFTSFINILYYAYLPIIVVVIGILGGWLYSVRAIAIRVVSEDYVFMAKAKGLPERQVIRHYVLRVIAGPAMTLIILGLAGSIGGFIITESVFDWPGIGLLYYAAITTGDSPTIIGLVYITTLVYIIARFILEVLYVILDPRVSL